MEKCYNKDKVSKHVPMEPIPDEVLAQYLRPGEILTIQEKFPVAFQPIGTLEWHGRQNPIGCDAIKAESLCIRTAKRTGGVVMPPIYFSVDAYRDCGKGYGYGMDAEAGFLLPGSYYQADIDLFKKFIENACRNYLSRGFKLVVLVSGHNPQIQQNILDEVCYNFKTPEGIEPVYFTMEYNTIEPGNPRRGSDHGGGYETSMMLHLAKDRVNMKANDNCEFPTLALYEEFPVSEASEEEGRIRLELQVEGLVKIVQNKMNAVLNKS